MLHTGDAERRTESRTRSRPTEEVTDSELVDEEAQEIEARLLNARRQRQQKVPWRIRREQPLHRREAGTIVGLSGPRNPDEFWRDGERWLRSR
jgi:hypothetical protein